MALKNIRGGDFIQRFADKYELYGEWLKNPNNRNEEDISAGTLSKREEDEEDREETDSTLPGHRIHGFENEINSLEDFLLNPKVYNEFKSLTVVGEYGVGKTALCKMIFNNGNVKSVYSPRIWVSMHSSKDPEEGKIKKVAVLRRILKGLGVEESILASIQKDAQGECDRKNDTGEINVKNDRQEAEEKEELPALLYALHLNLRWRKYLIVLDDVRVEDEWNEILQDDEEKLKEDEEWGKHLSDGFPKGSGGRVIYTTRDESLAKKLVAEEIHRLWPLSDSQTVWNIYEESYREVDVNREPPRNDKKCLDELMDKSRGLPLAVRLLGKLDPVFLDDEETEEDVTYELAANQASMFS